MWFMSLMWFSKGVVTSQLESITAFQTFHALFFCGGWLGIHLTWHKSWWILQRPESWSCLRCPSSTSLMLCRSVLFFFDASCRAFAIAHFVWYLNLIWGWDTRNSAIEISSAHLDRSVSSPTAVASRSHLENTLPIPFPSAAPVYTIAHQRLRVIVGSDFGERLLWILQKYERYLDIPDKKWLDNFIFLGRLIVRNLIMVVYSIGVVMICDSCWCCYDFTVWLCYVVLRCYDLYDLYDLCWLFVIIRLHDCLYEGKLGCWWFGVECYGNASVSTVIRSHWFLPCAMVLCFCCCAGALFGGYIVALLCCHTCCSGAKRWEPYQLSSQQG